MVSGNQTLYIIVSICKSNQLPASTRQGGWLLLYLHIDTIMYLIACTAK